MLCWFPVLYTVGLKAIFENMNFPVWAAKAVNKKKIFNFAYISYMSVFFHIFMAKTLINLKVRRISILV